MILRRNDVSPAVRQLGADLEALGYFAGPAGTTFDLALWKAVKAFQMQNVDTVGRPLVVDGVAGPVTLAAVARKKAGGMPVIPLVAGGIAMPPAGGSPTARGALTAALGELAAGRGEIGGNNMGPDVAKYLHGIVQPPADWCAAFVSWCFQNSGQDMPYKFTLGARDTLQQLRKKGWGISPNDSAPPLPGDVIVWWRGSPTGWQGHIGLIHSYSDGIVRTIEGNKTPKVGTFTYTLGSISRLLGFARVP